jgi:hypothetical protein
VILPDFQKNIFKTKHTATRGLQYPLALSSAPNHDFMNLMWSMQLLTAACA